MQCTAVGADAEGKGAVIFPHAYLDATGRGFQFFRQKQLNGATFFLLLFWYCCCCSCFNLEGKFSDSIHLSKYTKAKMRLPGCFVPSGLQAPAYLGPGARSWGRLWAPMSSVSRVLTPSRPYLRSGFSLWLPLLTRSQPIHPPSFGIQCSLKAKGCHVTGPFHGWS